MDVQLKLDARLGFIINHHCCYAIAVESVVSRGRSVGNIFFFFLCLCCFVPQYDAQSCMPLVGRTVFNVVAATCICVMSLLMRFTDISHPQSRESTYVYSGCLHLHQFVALSVRSQCVGRLSFSLSCCLHCLCV